MASLARLRTSNERVRDAFWAAVGAALLSFFGLVSPIDQAVWIYQALLSEEAVSGDIVFASSRDNLADPNDPQQRERLGEKLELLAASNVEHVYLDVVFDRAANPAADRALAEGIEALGSRVTMVRRVSTDMAGGTVVEKSLPGIVGSAEEVASDRVVNYLGFTWTMPLSLDTEEGRFATLPAVLAGTDRLDGVVPIDYRFIPASIPQLDLDAELATDAAGKLAGKKLVIGNRGISEREAANLPGLPGVPGSYVSIYAAETLKAGYTKTIHKAAILALFVIVVIGGLLSVNNSPSWRQKLYAFVALSIPAMIFVAAYFHVRISIAAAAVFLLWYGALRFRARWQKRFALEDDKTGLPTFRALEKVIVEKGPPQAIVVAKVHGYQEVVKALPPDLHAQYVRSLVERFRVTEKDMSIYANEGRYFAWGSKENSQQDLEAHLDGLRALFSTPIKVGETELDAGITFGVDMSGEPNPARRIASAVAAAEHTDEAHRPIAFAEENSETDALWKLSLQARIDQALDKGEIYLVYQPKVDVVAGKMVGVEALVRWNDPARGHISPAFFIQECERAGRMDHLTNYVLREAVNAAVILRGHGIDAKMSVNISATLLRDTRVEQMVIRALTESNLPPHLLVLEITETARILDLDHAVAVLERLRETGASISIDDFGVGAANLETIYKLPLDELKIDREFVANIEVPKAAAIIGSVIAFGKATGISVVAEGAEDPETIRRLVAEGCAIIQGYGISRPLAFDDLLQFQWDNEDVIKKNMV